MVRGWELKVDLDFVGSYCAGFVEMGFLWGGEEGGVFLYMALHWCGAVYYGFFSTVVLGCSMVKGGCWLF